MSEATARPWRLEYWNRQHRELGCPDDAHFASVLADLPEDPENQEFIICDLRGTPGRDYATGPGREDASLIVKAVNAHDELLYACELAIHGETCVCEGGECLHCILTAAVKAAKP